MKYFIHGHGTRDTRPDRLVPRSLDEYKVENQLMYLPFGDTDDTDKKSLPEFTVYNMGVAEKVNNAFVFDSDSEAVGEVTQGENTAAASDVDNLVVPNIVESDLVEFGSLEAHGKNDVLSFPSQASNGDKGNVVSVRTCGIRNTKDPNPMLQNAPVISTASFQQFKDILKPGDRVLVFDFNDDGRWVDGAVIVSEGQHLDTWKIQVGTDTRDIGKFNVSRESVPAVEKPNSRRNAARKASKENIMSKPTIMSNPNTMSKPTTVSNAATMEAISAIAGTALCGNELVTKAPHHHSSSSCINCLSSTWACRYNPVNIKTATLLEKVGLIGHVTKAEGNLCLYRAFHELLPDNIPSIDLDEEGAKKIFVDIVKNQLVRQQDLDNEFFADIFAEETANLLKDLNWEGKCKGLQAGYIMQAMADHFQQTFNLFTVDLVADTLRCEQFTCLKPGGISSEYLNIVCVPGIGQLLGGNTYDMHYIPAFKVHSAEVNIPAGIMPAEVDADLNAPAGIMPAEVAADFDAPAGIPKFILLSPHAPRPAITTCTWYCYHHMHLVLLSTHAPVTVINTCTWYCYHNMHLVLLSPHSPGTAITTCTRYCHHHMHLVLLSTHAPGIAITT